jgi:hypothetical protein
MATLPTLAGKLRNRANSPFPPPTTWVGGTAQLLLPAEALLGCLLALDRLQPVPAARSAAHYSTFACKKVVGTIVLMKINSPNNDSKDAW